MVVYGESIPEGIEEPLIQDGRSICLPTLSSVPPPPPVPRYGSLYVVYIFTCKPCRFMAILLLVLHMILLSVNLPLDQVGVDNMCILVNAVKRQARVLSLEERISNALVEVGPSITLASLSEVLAFAVGGFISMPACRVFSMFAGIILEMSLLINF